jgi:purine-binding chemotaxis protein CheW
MGEMTATLTDATMHELVIMEVGDVLCGLDLTQIQEISKLLDITPVHHAPAYVRGVVNLRGQIVTVIDVRSKCGFAPLELNEDHRIVVVRWAGENIGLLVDRVQDIAMIEARDVLEPPANFSSVNGAFFAGIYPMEQGLVAIVRLAELLNRDTHAALA